MEAIVTCMPAADDITTPNLTSIAVRRRFRNPVRRAWPLTAAPVAALQQNGVTGGDIMDLEDDDLATDLGLSRLQVPRLLPPPTASSLAAGLILR